MIPLYNNIDFQNAKSQTLLLIKCEFCNKSFHVTKRDIKVLFNREKRFKRNISKYCSIECQTNATKKQIKCSCTNCNNEFYKKQSEITKNNFCSQSCFGHYNNKHKTTGTRRSKLETWLEQQLTFLYPTLEIHYNKIETINAELDIYIPSLNVAFELNGIFHYEPIFGQDKLDKTKNNDNRKFQACNENLISLCIIDTSQQKYFKESSSLKYLNIITNIINDRIAFL